MRSCVRQWAGRVDTAWTAYNLDIGALSMTPQGRRTSSKYWRISKIRFAVLMEWGLGTLLHVCRNYSHMEANAR